MSEEKAVDPLTIVINEWDPVEFSEKVSDCLREGFIVSSSSSGWIDPPYEQHYYIAIMVK